MIAIRTKRIRTLIQIGERTHHHDQVMWPVSFRPIKRMVRRPVNPIPPEEEDDEELRDIVVSLLQKYYKASKGTSEVPLCQLFKCLFFDCDLLIPNLTKFGQFFTRKKDFHLGIICTTLHIQLFLNNSRRVPLNYRCWNKKHRHTNYQRWSNEYKKFIRIHNKLGVLFWLSKELIYTFVYG